ncbi:PREDICTED: probable VAMP-like protein At1g33475 [Fragaria vesca subsp. vesca]|uniref:probable VAMP-like protein At1g33475 n=1 Tax=Fragaria vesca subsp. vesca TaxID=101020 RepID=UPI0002C3656E|nr:PREDICTED: probable VAMP-like protein At1g33475 [Fragaria vesca subsp. vesca]
MISNPSLIYYACIAQKETILGEIAKEPGIGALAQKCIEKTPPHHSLYTHTVRKRTYLFSIADPFVFFGVFDQDLDQSEAVAFLNRLRCDFERVKGDNGVEVGSHCYQAEFDSIVREIMAANSEVDMPPASRNLSMDSSSGKGKRMVLAPLLGNHGLKKKKRLSGEVNGEVCKDVAMSATEKKVDVMCEDGRDFVMPVAQKSGGLVSSERQKAKQVWRKHVWVVLMLDLFVCAVLFGVWLWVCRGLKCIDS